MHESWHEHLIPYLCNEESNELFNKITLDKKTNNVYPKTINVFNVFEMPLTDIKVVILGQDPYYTKDVATGYAFGVKENANIAPSLRNIIKEVHRTEGKGEFDKTLKSWTDQGVFLLNTALTVREGEPNSHTKIWKPFINFVFSVLNYNRSNIIFLLWGGKAKAYSSLINENHITLESPHPSPLATGFIGNDHFNKTNKILIKNGKEPIKWI